MLFDFFIYFWHTQEWKRIGRLSWGGGGGVVYEAPSGPFREGGLKALKGIPPVVSNFMSTPCLLDSHTSHTPGIFLYKPL